MTDTHSARSRRLVLRTGALGSGAAATSQVRNRVVYDWLESIP